MKDHSVQNVLATPSDEPELQPSTSIEPEVIQPTSTPTPKPVQAPRKRVTPKPSSTPQASPSVEPSPVAVAKTKLKSSTMIRRGIDCAKTPNVPGCCIDVLKLSGDLPDVKVARDGTARTVPTKPLDIKEGETAIVVTHEGPINHVNKIQMKEGKLKVIKEGGMGYKSVGRELNPKVIKGEVAL